MKSQTKLFAAVALAAFMLMPRAAAAETVIHAGHLIATPGQPARDKQSIIVDGGKIVAIKDGFVSGKEVIDLKDAWVIPGLIDMHAHITGVLDLGRSSDDQIALSYIRPQAEAVLSILPTMKALLANGFTTVRSPGDQSGTAYALRDAINAGVVDGPRLFAIEPQIAVDGGDLDSTRNGVREELKPYVSNRGDCTGVVDCTRVVRQEIRRGADFIKLRQAGAPADNPRIEMLETEEEVKAIIDTAHRLDRRVAVHVVGSPAFLHMVIKAGADTVEHGPLDDESIALMKASGASYTPTILAAKMIDYRWKDAQQGALKAFRAGVPIIFGTDLGIMNTTQMHAEFGLLAEAGIPPAEVLRAATVNAAAALGKADELGTITPGKSADIVALKIDPLTHIAELGKAEQVVFVMKAGKTFKAPAR